MGRKPIVSVTYENERISIKNSLPYLKCVLRLSCVVHGPIYGRFMGFYVHFRYGKLFLLKSFHFRRLQKRQVFFPIQILIFRTLRNNADVRRCSYFELGLPVMWQAQKNGCLLSPIPAPFSPSSPIPLLSNPTTHTTHNTAHSCFYKYSEGFFPGGSILFSLVVNTTFEGKDTGSTFIIKWYTTLTATAFIFLNQP